MVATLSWAGGQTAVLTATPGNGQLADDLVVLGSRGALYYETPAHVPARLPPKAAAVRPAARQRTR